MRRILIFGLAVIAVLGLVVSATVAVAADGKADINGLWEMEVETPAGSGAPIFELKEQGGKITGTYTGTLGESDVTGTIKGNEFTIKFEVFGAAGSLESIYRGKLTGKTMKGVVDLGPIGTGTFSGKKK